MFEPNFRYPYNDGAVWIPTALLTYINESGDLSVLDEEITFIKGDTASNTGYDRGTKYEKYSDICTQHTSSVFDHLQRGMDYLYNCRGKRGLVLLLGGDWNDSLNGAGYLGKGEGVWLTIATVKAYNEFIEILKLAGKLELVDKYSARRDEMRECVIEGRVDFIVSSYPIEDEFGEDFNYTRIDDCSFYFECATYYYYLYKNNSLMG
jgi:cyclic beta-1,2-glucan synthetase